MEAAETGTVGREGKYGEAYLIHQVDGVTYKTKISTLRGDYQKPDGTIGNRLRLWEKRDFKPRPDDLLQERLYCVQWMRPKKKGKGDEYEFRSVTEDDLDAGTHRSRTTSPSISPTGRTRAGCPTCGSR